MKILYISGSYVPSRSASSVHIMKMCSALAKVATSVELVTKACASREEPAVESAHDFYGVEADFRLTRLSRPPWRGGGLVFMQRVRNRLLHTDPITLVYARELVGAWQAARLGFRVVFEAHAPPQGPISRLLLDRLIRSERLQRVVMISQALADIMTRSTPALAAIETVVAHDAADEIPLVAHTVQRGKPKLGYVGHLYPGRGVQIVFEVGRRHPDVEVHLVGGWPQDVERWRSATSGSNVRLHGFIPPRDLPGLYAELDILLMPYQKRVGVRSGRSDTAAWMSPMKMFEYMSAGKAIISSDLPVLREVLSDGRNALLVQPDSPDAWVEAVARLRRDRDLRMRLGAQARLDFEHEHTWRARAKKVLEGLRV